MNNLSPSASQEIDLGGHKVFVGSRVNIRWKGNWYDGRVLKLGPKRNLCRIRDLSSNQTLLLESHELKFGRTQVPEKRLLPGNYVSYSDGDRWLDGTVVTSRAVGVLQASWRKSVRATESQNWFEIVDVAPILHGEAYLERNSDEVVAGKNGLLLHNNPVDLHPCQTMEHTLFDTTEEDRGTDMVDHFSLRPSRHNGFLPTSPTYEEIDKEFRIADRTKTRPLPNPPLDQITDVSVDPWLSASPSFTPSHSIQHPALSMMYPHVKSYAPSVSGWGMGPSAAPHHPTHPFLIPHPKPAATKTLEHSTLPCALSYQLNYQNGIPPHRSSNYFRQMKRTIALPSTMSRNSQSSDSDIFRHSLMRTSPSILSRAMSEPVSTSSTLQAIPPREKKKRNHLFSGKKKKSKKSKKPEPLPYEVPTKTLEVIVDEDSSQEGDKLNELETERSELITPKKKAQRIPVISSSSPSLLTVNMGENILITCIGSSKASVAYEWHKDGLKLPGKARNIEELSPGKLEIRNAQQEDEGMYRCLVKNKHGSETRYFRLNVNIQYRTPTKIIRQSPHRMNHNKKAKSEEAKKPVSPPEEDHPEEPKMVVSHPEEDQSVKKFLDNIIDDIQIPDVEFSMGEPENGEEKAADKENDDRDATDFGSAEGGDKLMDIPEIAGTTDRKSKIVRRVSIGNKAGGEMDLYLGGYGEDYGSKSSTTDLELEGLRLYKEREIKKSLAAREKGRKSTDSSPTKSSGEEATAAPKTFKQKTRKLLNFSRFVRKKKKATTKVEDVTPKVPQLQHHDGDITRPHNDVTRPHNDVTDQAHHNDSTVPTHSIDVSTHPHDSITNQTHNDVTCTVTKPAHVVVPQIVIENPHISGERDSIAVNTSLGGTDSEETLVDEAAADKMKGHVHLPLESETVSDRVRLLQQSVKEHHPDDIVAETSRKKGFFSGIFSKGKNTI